MISKKPEGDIWYIIDTDEQSQWYGRNFKFNFSYILNTEIKELYQDYIWQNYKVGNKVLHTLYSDVNVCFNRFVRFAQVCNIKNLRNLTNADTENYKSYLCTYISETTGKPIASSTQKGCFCSLRSVVGWCRIHRPEEVPAYEIFTGNEYSGFTKKVKIEFIPDEVLCQIHKALETEENLYLKYGIIIMESTGIRIGDLLKLRIDCIKPHLISGFTIEWLQHKTRKMMSPMPVRKECVDAVEKLIELTSDIRGEAAEKDKNTLMIRRSFNDKVVNISRQVFGQEWLGKFVRVNNIKDTNGEFYNLTSHQFRRTLGTDMLSKGTNINVVQQVLGHADPSITKRFYADIKDKERAEIFKNVGIIGNINNLKMDTFDTASDYEWFMKNKDKCVSGLCDGYCMKPVKEGICDRLLRRQKCYTCSRYITTPEYLEAHKKHLVNLERQLSEGVIYGEHYAEHFIPTIEVLQTIIRKLEDLQNGP